MKKSVVVILMVAFFSGHAFAGSPACKYGDKSGLLSSTKASSASTSGTSTGTSK